jgi:N-succinyldiaminopimelate aminotransferase
MNSELDLLQPYPFEKLRQLFTGLNPDSSLAAITLGIGEPQHPAPEFVLQALRENLDLLAKYPQTLGIGELRQTAARWTTQRFGLPGLDADSQLIPVTGTREALFAIAQAVVNRDHKPLVIAPNPFYQIYEGAALLAGAELKLLNCTAENNFAPDFDDISDEEWQRCQLLFLCSPGNPTGAVLSENILVKLIQLSIEHDFVIASDECYSEIYQDEDSPPVGLLQACVSAGNLDFKNCLIFQSLSKRSNLPGLRSGFVAGDADILKKFMLYRTYQGCAMPPHHQVASVAAWSNEEHVRENRIQYRLKFDAVLTELNGVLELRRPSASFYLWPQTPIADTDFAAGLYEQKNLTVLPGRFLGRECEGGNPGAGHVRMALVASVEQCTQAARRIRQFVETL